VERRGLADDPFAWPGRRGREADPALQAEHNEQARAILAAVALLGDTQRRLFQLRYRDRLSYRQIAEVCDLTPGQVGGLLSSARREIKAHVRKAAVKPRS
jgi:RNA polymerase sigma factor (sigma-70 family)